MACLKNNGIETLRLVRVTKDIDGERRLEISYRSNGKILEKFSFRNSDGELHNYGWKRSLYRLKPEFYKEMGFAEVTK